MIERPIKWYQWDGEGRKALMEGMGAGEGEGGQTKERIVPAERLGLTELQKATEQTNERENLYPHMVTPIIDLPV